MKTLKYFALATAFGCLLLAPTFKADAQIGVSIGVAPVCPYGYYEEPPYTCAPDGYYGPEWFTGGVFVGAGPWFHGPKGFHGHVDHALDYRQGYHGPTPGRGEHPAEHRAPFHGQAEHDEHGHEYHAPHR
jgi:hypothetical protein